MCVCAIMVVLASVCKYIGASVCIDISNSATSVLNFSFNASFLWVFLSLCYYTVLVNTYCRVLIEIIYASHYL